MQFFKEAGFVTTVLFSYLVGYVFGLIDGLVYSIPKVGHILIYFFVLIIAYEMYSQKFSSQETFFNSSSYKVYNRLSSTFKYFILININLLGLLTGILSIVSFNSDIKIFFITMLILVYIDFIILVYKLNKSK